MSVSILDVAPLHSRQNIESLSKSALGGAT